MTSLSLPGGIGLSHLRVYDTPAPDGLVGGSAHVHLVCKEAYLVVAGEGTVQTLSASGYSEVALESGKLVWFTPGLIHRLVNLGNLEIMVVMANAGMPEAGDFAFAFPEAVMQDAEAYNKNISLASAGHVHASGEEAAQKRRDLAVEGFLELRKAFERGGVSALTTFYRHAAERVQAQVKDWHEVHDAGPVAEVNATEARLTALEAGRLEYLQEAAIHAALPPETRKLGMCGRLNIYTPEGQVSSTGGTENVASPALRLDSSMTLSPIPLSVLELAPVSSGMSTRQALANTLMLAQHAERLGYNRFWLAEHHNTPGIASAVPELLIAQVAGVTKTMRVGSGGVMLPNHSSLHVAETFKTLEAFYPGRIDLGIGRAPGTDGLTALALRRSREALQADDFDEQLGELFAFGSGEFPAGHPFGRVRAMPMDTPLPPVYLLGSSDYSARLAGSLGLPFAFAYHFSPHSLMGALAAYRNTFTSGALTKPHAIVTASVFCAPTDEEADFLAGPMRLTFLKLRSGDPGQLPTPEEARDYPYDAQERAALEHIRAMQIVGSPDTVRRELNALIEKTGADELMVTTMMHAHEDRLRSFALVAEALSGVAA